LLLTQNVQSVDKYLGDQRTALDAGVELVTEILAEVPIRAAPEVWPTRVKLDGLTYGSLAPSFLPISGSLLERDNDGYVPHAYKQLAAAYRRVGDDAGARAVQLAKQRRHRATLSWYAKLWGHVQDTTVGYGYRPTRAMTWLLALLFAGTVVYGLHHPRPVEPGKHWPATTKAGSP
jgi:hypothetical protein